MRGTSGAALVCAPTPFPLSVRRRPRVREMSGAANCCACDRTLVNAFINVENTSNENASEVLGRGESVASSDARPGERHPITSARSQHQELVSPGLARPRPRAPRR